MTREEQRLADDKIRAEIAKLIEEAGKIRAERIWHPFVVVGGLFAAAFAVVKVIAGW